MNFIFIEMFSRGIKRKYFKSKKVARGLNFLILTHEMPVTALQHLMILKSHKLRERLLRVGQPLLPQKSDFFSYL